MSSIASLFFLLCVIASVVGEVPPVLEEVIAQSETKCRAEELCTTVTALKGAVTNITSKVEKEGNDLKELTAAVINTINPKLDIHTAALTKITDELRSIASKIDKSEIERRMQAEDFKAIVMQLEEQGRAEKLQTQAINNLTVSINDQSKVLETLTLLTSTVANKLQKHSENLLDHDKYLKAHDQLQKTQNEELRVVCGSMGKPIDCREILDRRYSVSGAYQVYPGGLYPADVYCDMTTPGGPWLVFQRRKDGSVNSESTWKEYSDGFGIPTGELWLGNNLEGFHNGMQFSTKDADHDTYGGWSSFRGQNYSLKAVEMKIALVK